MSNFLENDHQIISEIFINRSKSQGQNWAFKIKIINIHMYNSILDRDKKISFLVKLSVLVCDVDLLNNLEPTFASADVKIEGPNFLYEEAGLGTADFEKERKKYLKFPERILIFILLIQLCDLRLRISADFGRGLPGFRIPISRIGDPNFFILGWIEKSRFICISGIGIADFFALGTSIPGIRDFLGSQDFFVFQDFFSPVFLRNSRDSGFWTSFDE